MGTIRVLTGQRYNLLERGVVTVSSQDANLGPSNLYDGRPSLYFKFGAVAADDYVSVDGDELAGTGTFEAADASPPPAGWTEENGGTGDCEIDTAQFNSGASSLLMKTGASGFGAAYYAKQVRAGASMKLSWAIRGDGTGRADIRLLNVRTGKYLQPGGASWGALANLDTQTTAAWKAGSVTFQVESFATNLYVDPILRVYVLNATGVSTSAWVDDVSLYPAVDFLGVFGHNLEPGMSSTALLSSDNAFAASNTEATITLQPGSFYALLSSPQYHRYWRYKLTGTNNSGPTILGEVVIGQTFTLTRNMKYPVEWGHTWDDVSASTEMGETLSQSRAQFFRRTLGLHFLFDTHTAYDESRGEVFARSNGRVNPIVVVPDPDRPEVVHGRLDRTWKVLRGFTEYYSDNDLTVMESPLPRVTS